jgi:hypothetical protein
MHLAMPFILGKTDFQKIPLIPAKCRVSLFQQILIKELDAISKVF